MSRAQGRHEDGDTNLVAVADLEDPLGEYRNLISKFDQAEAAAQTYVTIMVETRWRQCDIVHHLTKVAKIYTTRSLADALGVSQTTISRQARAWATWGAESLKTRPSYHEAITGTPEKANEQSLLSTAERVLKDPEKLAKLLDRPGVLDGLRDQLQPEPTIGPEDEPDDEPPQKKKRGKSSAEFDAAHGDRATVVRWDDIIDEARPSAGIAASWTRITRALLEANEKLVDVAKSLSAANRDLDKQNREFFDGEAEDLGSEQWARFYVLRKQAVEILGSFSNVETITPYKFSQDDAAIMIDFEAGCGDNPDDVIGVAFDVEALLEYPFSTVEAREILRDDAEFGEFK